MASNFVSYATWNAHNNPEGYAAPRIPSFVRCAENQGDLIHHTAAETTIPTAVLQQNTVAAAELLTVVVQARSGDPGTMVLTRITMGLLSYGEQVFLFVICRWRA